MARKKEVLDKNVEEISKNLKAKKILIGTDRTVKSLKLGKVQKVFLASNCPSDVENDIAKYSKMSGAEVISLEQNNEDLGFICKKRYSISVLSVPKGAN